jgi:integrase
MMAAMVTVSLFARGRVLWAKIKGVDGRWKNVSTGKLVGDEDAARRWALELAEQAAAERAAGATSGPLTVRQYAGTWLEQRRATGHDHKNDNQRLRDHVLPVIGELAIAEVRPRHLAAMVAGLRAGHLAPRTIRNVYAVASALFRDAKLADLVDQTPAILTAEQLGPIVDKDPTVRGEAVFTRAEIERLISDDRVPLDRQVVYGLGALAGLRHGEIAGLRWRHYDPSREPLGQLVIATSYGRGRTKTGVVRRVPALPALAALLATWRLSGWPAMFGRVPDAEDLVVPLEPDPPKKQARPNPRAGGMRSSHDTETRRDRDLAALGMRHRRTHDLRATFVTLAEDAGVPRHVVKQLTHTAPSREAYQGYSRPQWETLCRELARLQVDRRVEREVTRLPLLVGAGGGGDDALGTPVVQVPARPEKTKSHHVLGDGSWRSGRDSNPIRSGPGDAPRQSFRVVDGGEVSPCTTATPGAVPRLGTARLDVGLDVMVGRLLATDDGDDTGT